MKFFPVVLALAAALPAFASDGTRGGGRLVVCRDPGGNIKSTELLDLWEARVLYHRTIVPSARPLAEQVDLALQALKFSADLVETPFDSGIGADYMLGELKGRADLFLKTSPNVNRLRGVTLNPTNDSNEPASPRDCGVEQVVDYLDVPRLDPGYLPQILVDQDLLDHMDVTNQAALIAHESLYSVLREHGETDSLRTRRSIGYVFAGASFPRLDAMLGNKFVECSSTKGYGPLSRIYFFLDRGNVVATTAFAFGRASVGFFEPSPYQFFGPKLDFAVNQPCVDGLQDPMFSSPIVGVGPADHDRAYYVRGRCENKRVVLYLSKEEDASLGDGPQAIEPLSCVLMTK